MTDTAHGVLPLIDNRIQAGYLLYNEAMWKIDALVFSGVIDRDLTTPPESPSEGDVYIPATNSTGAWNGHDDDIAHYYNGSWHFYTPVEGWRIWLNDEDTLAVWDGSAWI